MSFQTPNRIPDFEARMTFVSRPFGRIAPVQSGYATVHDFGPPNTALTAMHEYSDPGFETHEWVYPGDTVEAYVWLLAPEAFQGRMRAFTAFHVLEGAQIVAQGEILAVLNPLLRGPQ